MGGKSGKKVTVGYRYYMDIQAGLGRGPVNEIPEIRVDDKTVFAGNAGELSSSRAIFIDKPSLFGGDDTGGEGGIQGRLEVLMGESDQKPSGMLQNLINGILNPNSKAWMENPDITPHQSSSARLIPGFRGVVCTVFSGLISSYSAYPKLWAYRVRRTSRGWTNNAVWYPAKLTILLKNEAASIVGLTAAQTENIKTIHAMNPAHILIECATNKDWGNGLELNDINTDSYTRAADTLYDEKFGLCFRYNRQESLNNFVQQILDHVGGVQYVDLESGKLTLSLIRNNYTPDQLPVFTYDNGILSVQDDDSASTENAPNEIIVSFHDPVMNKAGTVRIQNMASIQAYGAIPSTADYKAIPTYDLAARVGQRDLEMGASGLTRLKIKFDRRGGQLAPADVFRVNLSDRGIENMVMRVGKITESEDGSFTIVAIQDVFGLPATNYNTTQPPIEWTPPDRTALPVTNSLLMEVPYHVLAATLSAADLSYLPPSIGFIGVCAQAPTSLSINYLLQTRAAGAAYRDITTGDWTAVGMLLNDVTFTDSVLNFNVNVDFSAFKVGTSAVIGHEIVRINAVNATTGVITVGRGCADTLPEDHLGGSLLWFYQEAEGDGVEYATGETVNARLLTNTTTAQLDAGLAPSLAVKMQQRQYRPYPPGNFKINGQPTRMIDDRTAFTLTWSHRDRVQQADNLFDHTVGDIGPEEGTTYLIRLYLTNTLVRTITLTGNSFAYPDRINETTQLPILDNFNKVTVYSKRGDVESLQGYTLTVT